MAKKYIDAEWLLDVVENIIEWDTERDRNRIIHQVRELTPTADVRENVRGEWEVIDFEEPRRYGCTKCKMLCFYPYNFCPNCGADMRGDNHDKQRTVKPDVR